MRKIYWIDWEKLCWPKSVGGMGFRDLQAFNLAMLAKQGWQLICFLDALVARILRAKYYPNKKFMDAAAGHNASYTWKSIIAGKKVLKKGLVWKVESGGRIDIWKDPWIPTKPIFRVEVSRIRMENLLKVSKLMEGEEDRWNKELVRSMFDETDVEAILQIPLRRSNNEDFPFWIPNRKGLFTVKNAYRVMTKQIIEGKIEAGDEGYHKYRDLESMKALWKKI